MKRQQMLEIRSYSALSGAGRVLLALMFFMVSTSLVFAQKTVTGIVTGSDNSPLPGVSIVVKGTTTGTITDINGKYSLSVPADAKTIIFTFVGMESKEIAIGSSNVYNVTLSESLVGLEEVVVVGYGTQKKVNLTGSVATVNSKSLEARPVSNASQALEGLVPGLNIKTSGYTGGSLENRPTINIRGITTIGQGSSGQALILIDGMEGDINALNPQDIENISVLKDAAASSIYGSRAPFGVILITTKKGKVGKPQVTINSNFRSSSPVLLPQPADSYTWALFFNEANNNSGYGDFFSPVVVQRIKDYRDGKIDPANTVIPNPLDPNYWDNSAQQGNTNIDWYKETYKSHTPSQEHSVSVSGGTEQLTYYISGSSLNQEGLLKLGGDNFKRNNVTAKLTAKLADWASVSYSGRYSREDYERPTWLNTNVFSTINSYSAWPMTPHYDPNGFLYRLDEESPTFLEDGGRYNSQNDQTYHQFQLTLEPVKGWKIFGDFNYSINDNFQHTDYQQNFNHDVNGNPYLLWGNSSVREQVYRNNYSNQNIYTEYSRAFGDHNLKAMVGFQSELSKYRDQSAQRQGIMVPSLPVLNITSGTDVNGKTVSPIVSGLNQEWSTGGYFGRINYDYQGRYLVEANLRYDGSSRWRAEKRWNYFPSVSVGWNVARENFWGNLGKYVNNLKIRGSYGELGNQNTTNNYPTYVTMPIGIASGTWLVNNTKPNIASAPGLISSSLTWEKIRTWNIGADLGFLENRLTASFDYYNRFTKDMIGPAPELPVTLGTAVPTTNNTDLKTYGFELNINWHDNLENGLGYNINLILSDSKTKITRYPNPTGNLAMYREGQMMGEIWGYQTIGIAKTDAEMDAHLAYLTHGAQDAIGSNWRAGDIMYQDLNGDGKIDGGANTESSSGDLKIIGNSTPHYIFGMDLSADWKGFDVRAFFQGVLKRDYWPGTSNTSPFWGASARSVWHSNCYLPHLDYFRDDPNNPLGLNLDSYYPRPLFDNVKNQQPQSRYVQDASYVRLKNLQIGYTIPQSITQKIAIQKLRVYFSGENLLTFSKISKLFDPETIDGGWGGSVYPLSKTYSLGVNINF